MDWSGFFGALLGSGSLALLLAMFPEKFLGSYLTEKGKNLATKEDIEAITRKTEAVKTEYLKQLELIKHELLADNERLKISLLSDEQVVERRRKAYEQMVEGLRVFISGHANDATKEKFHSAYATAWLWASDEVLQLLNSYLDLQIKRAADKTSVEEGELRYSQAALVIAMRKDAGHISTNFKPTDYRFTTF